ncbi:MAG TPA: hypothetical protein VGA16_08615 [Candidatus Limnocylindria bacterium]
MRSVTALALVVVAAVIACGGGSSSPPIRLAPAVTSAPTADPNAPATPKPTGGYDYGY